MELKESYPIFRQFNRLEPIGIATVTKDMKNNQLVIKAKFFEDVKDIVGKGVGIGGVIKDLKKFEHKKIEEFDLQEIAVLRKDTAVDDENVWKLE